MKTTTRTILDIVWYLVVFVLIQAFAFRVVGLTYLLMRGMDFQHALVYMRMHSLLSSTTVIVSSAVSGLLTILLFALCKWSPVSRSYLRSKPWVVLVWVVLLAIGTLIPSTWMLEQLDVEVPTGVERMLTALLGSPWGYLAVGVLTPIAEEMVFRGAILRSLSRLFAHRSPWIAIALSALIFGLAHGNKAQLAHAFLMGLLLGWMYWRTKSIVPGVVLHWVNNTAIFILYNVVPNSSGIRLVDLFGGSQRAVWLSLLFSLCIMLPALYQLTLRLPGASRRP